MHVDFHWGRKNSLSSQLIESQFKPSKLSPGMSRANVGQTIPAVSTDDFR
jgi:hypothetical protein